MTTKKREYEKPSMQAFDLKQQPTLLQASVQNYTFETEDPE